MSQRTCSVSGCDGSHRARGLCSKHWKRLYQVRRSVLMQCANCGSDVTKEPDRRKRNVFCSWECRTDFYWGQDRSGGTTRELVHVGPVAHRRGIAPTIDLTRRRPRTWCSGPCAWCGENFTIVDQLQARYCSRKCSRLASKAAGGEFAVSPDIRRAIYERDGWTCQLCGEPIDRTADYLDDWAPSLDHIECQSWSLIPDHSPENLRTAHRWCNSVRGNETYYTAAVLVA